MHAVVDVIIIVSGITSTFSPFCRGKEEEGGSSSHGLKSHSHVTWFGNEVITDLYISCGPQTIPVVVRLTNLNLKHRPTQVMASHDQLVQLEHTLLCSPLWSWTHFWKTAKPSVRTGNFSGETPIKFANTYHTVSLPCCLSSYKRVRPDLACPGAL